MANVNCPNCGASLPVDTKKIIIFCEASIEDVGQGTASGVLPGK